MRRDVVRRGDFLGDVDELRNINSPAPGCRLSRVDGVSEFHAATARVVGDIVRLVERDVVRDIAQYVVRDVVPTFRE